MLSKLVANASQKYDRSQVAFELIPSLKATYSDRISEIEIISIGTSGVSLHACLDGEKRYFKTYPAADKCQVLETEVALLWLTSGGRTDASIVSGLAEDGSLLGTWLQTISLMPVSLEPPEVRGLISSYRFALNEYSKFDRVPLRNNFHILVSEAEAAFHYLLQRKSFEAWVEEEIYLYLNVLLSEYKKWPLQLCHGDLGPENIMADSQGPIAVDWEDVFWGIEDYDYLYWLTFFSNRKWLSRDWIGFSSMGITSEIAVMVAILLIKSRLSIANNSYIANKISFNERIAEVLRLNEGYFQ